jgi:rare lipoprotein A
MSRCHNASVVRISTGLGITGTRLVLALVSSCLFFVEEATSEPPILATQIGDATFYASAFDGRTTASGFVFDGRKAIAAHRTYPFGTVVRVTCLRNKRSVNVVIVDRGPYGKNRREGAIIDVSRAAAQKLGIIKSGQARVKLEVLTWGRGAQL